MRKKGILSGLLLVFAAAFALSANLAFADGMIVTPPAKVMMETDQKAVIFYDEGIEHLFLSVTFQGNAEDFAWIVPTPAQPEIGKSTDRLFTRLDELTRPEYPVPTQRSNDNMGGWSAVNEEKSVTVLETKEIEYYDISVLEANDNQALYNWLNDHGYRFPQAGNYIVDEYIQKGWVFTAVKINDQRLAAGGSRQLQTGHAIPLKLSFKTDKIVYPLKISSIMGLEDDAPEGEVTYIDGAVGKGVQLDTDRMLSTDEVIKDFSITDGTLTFYLKKRDKNPINNLIKIERSSASGLKEGLRVSNAVGNTYTFNLYTKNVNQRFLVDLGSDFKENEWQKFYFKWEAGVTSNKFEASFFIDDVQRTLNHTGSNNYPITNNAVGQNAVLSIGGEIYQIANSPQAGTGVDMYAIEPGASPNYLVNHSSDILIDEITLTSGENAFFNADFRDELKILLSGGQSDYLRVFSKDYYNEYGWAKPQGMGVLVYVFADKKYEIAGFDTQYAGPVDKEGIMNIAKLEGTTPWIEPAKDDYFLTRMYKYMDFSQMSEDLYPQESSDQSKYNYVGGEKTRFGLLLVLLVLSVGSMAAMVLLVLRSEKKKVQSSAESGKDEPREEKEKKESKHNS